MSVRLGSVAACVLVSSAALCQSAAESSLIGVRREPAVLMRPEREAFVIRDDKDGNVVYVGNVLEVSGRKNGLKVTNQSGFPGARPFRAPKTITLSTRHGAGGCVELTLGSRDRKKTEKRRAVWSEETVFPFDLKDDYWRFESLAFLPGKDTDMKFEILSLTAESPASAAESWTLDVDTGSPIYTTVDPFGRSPVCIVKSLWSRDMDVNGSVVARNYFGDTIDVPVAGVLPSGGELRVPIDFAQKTGPDWRFRGIWKVSAVLTAGEKTVTNLTRFAVLNRNVKSPRLSRDKFKLGINYHDRLYSDGERKLCVDALVACGAKLARAGGCSAEECWPARDKLDFSRADKFVGELRNVGIALNVGIHPNPRWMVAPETKMRSHWRGHTEVRTIPGLMGEFAEKVAARYGEDIDFLETSNEGDLWPDAPPTITLSEYIDYQKEVYAGAKRGCAAVMVLPSSWAQADSTCPMVTRKGFQEGVMEGAKGFYDIHPTHQHSTFPVFKGDCLGRLFPMRERLGITVPWYPNETALTTVNGAEDGVAKAVWMKIVWSWAHGAASYVWYNLRATGWDPKDSEQGYGLLEADFHPRAGFAAFSALAKVLSGADFKTIVYERKGRHVYLFRNGGDLVVMGWDPFPGKVGLVKVKTDAREAVLVDVMGNVRKATACTGGFVLELTDLPGALVLRTATFAEANETGLDDVPEPNTRKIVQPNIDGRPPDFHLFCWWHVHELYSGNPLTMDRTWKGPSDLSPAAWIGRTKDALRLKFAVRDDCHVQRQPPPLLWLSDGLQFVLESTDQVGNFEIGLAMSQDGKPIVYTWQTPKGFSCEQVSKSVDLAVRRDGDQTVYDAKIPFSAIGFDEKLIARGFRFTAIFHDDDGNGKDRDYWMEISPGIAGSKEYFDAPWIKFAEP